VEIFLDLVVKTHSDLVDLVAVALTAAVATVAAAEGAVAKTDLGSDVAVTETVNKNSH
jgi:hypothetical protein